MSSDIPLLRISGLAPPFSGDVKGLVLPRIKNKTVRSFLIAKGLPTLGPSDSSDPDLVRNFLKALPSVYTDAARGFTSSTMVFVADVFKGFKDMHPSATWSGASLRDVRDALKALAADLKATNSLMDLDTYAQVPDSQKEWSFMLLRVILDDLHGDNPDAIHAPAMGADYGALPTGPRISFGARVVAMAKRVSPWAFAVDGDRGDQQQAPPAPAGGGDKPPAQKRKRRESSRKKKRRRRDSTDSSGSSSSSSGSGSDSDEPKESEIPGVRAITDSQAQLAVLGLSSRSRVSGTDAITSLVKAVGAVAHVRDITEFVAKYVQLSEYVEIDLDGQPRAELASVGVFRSVERHLGAKPTVANINDSLLGVLEAIHDCADESKNIRSAGGARIFLMLRSASTTATRRIKRFSKNASQQSNLGRLRGLGTSAAHLDLSPREQALTDSLEGKIAKLEKLIKANRPGSGGGSAQRDSPHPMTILMDEVIKKKDMSRDEANKIARDLAGVLCISCKGPRKDNRCTANCGGGKVHSDLLAALAAKSL